MREEELGDRLGQILKDIHIPDGILAQLQKSLLNDKGREEEARRRQGERLAQRLSQVHRRLDQAYRKPFNLIFEKAKRKEWCARRDSNTRPLASEASALSS
jgi:hypothetical protein